MDQINFQSPSQPELFYDFMTDYVFISLRAKVHPDQSHETRFPCLDLQGGASGSKQLPASPQVTSDPWDGFGGP